MIGPLELCVEFAAILDDTDIPYALGGSLASSMLGEPRATMDIDVAVRLREERLRRLVGRLDATFYVPVSSATEAVRNRSSFNVLHESGLKVDVFVLGDGLLDRWQIDRRVEVEVAAGRRLWVTAPDVLILRKLDWFRQGESDRQWRDVVGLLTVQRKELDLGALGAQAEQLGVDRLLAEAIADSDDSI